MKNMDKLLIVTCWFNYKSNNTYWFITSISYFLGSICPLSIFAVFLVKSINLPVSSVSNDSKRSLKLSLGDETSFMNSENNQNSISVEWDISSFVHMLVKYTYE